MSPTGNSAHLWPLAGIPVGILPIACANAANVATARAAARYHKVGTRKVVGASHWQVSVSGQLWGEVLLLSLLACAVEAALARSAAVQCPGTGIELREGAKLAMGLTIRRRPQTSALAGSRDRRAIPRPSCTVAPKPVSFQSHSPLMPLHCSRDPATGPRCVTPAPDHPHRALTSL